MSSVRAGWRMPEVALVPADGRLLFDLQVQLRLRDDRVRRSEPGPPWSCPRSLTPVDAPHRLWSAP